MERILFVDHVNRILGGAEINLIELLETNSDRPLWNSFCACDPSSRLGAALNTLQIPQRPHSFGAAVNTFRLAGRGFSLGQAWRSRQALGAAGARLAQIVADINPAAVVSCTGKDHLAAGPICQAAAIPSIWWVNDIISAEFFSWPVRFIFARAARKFASRIVTVSEFAREALIATGIRSSAVRTIHNGIPVERYANCERGILRRELGAALDEPIVGLIGRFNPWKGQRFFLELARKWTTENRPGHFVLVGQAFNEDQSYETELRAFIQTHQLEKRVSVLPFREKIAELLCGLDVLVHASLKPEPFGRVLIEAMAAGVPVLAARAGGVPEILTEGNDGLLAEPGNIEAYAAQLEQLLRDRDLRQRLVENAAKKVKSRFTIERVQDDFARLFKELPSLRNDEGPMDE